MYTIYVTMRLRKKHFNITKIPFNKKFQWSFCYFCQTKKQKTDLVILQIYKQIRVNPGRSKKASPEPLPPLYRRILLGAQTEAPGEGSGGVGGVFLAHFETCFFYVFFFLFVFFGWAKAKNYGI